MLKHRHSDTRRRLNHIDTRKTLDAEKLKRTDARKSLRIREHQNAKAGENNENDYEDFLDSLDARTRMRWTDKQQSTVVHPSNDGWYGSSMPYKFELKFPQRKPHSSMGYRKKVRRGLTKVKTIVAFRKKPAMYNKDGGRNQSRLRPQSSRLRIKMSGELPPIRRSGSNMVKHQDSFNRHPVLPSIEKQNTGQHVDLSPGIMRRISKKILNRQKSDHNIGNEGVRQCSRHGRSGDRDPLNFGLHQRQRRPSLENVALLVTLSASLMGSQRRRQARRRSTANWRRLSNNTKQKPELWTRLQSRNLRSVWHSQSAIDKWFKVTSGIKVCYFLISVHLYIGEQDAIFQNVTTVYVQLAPCYVLYYIQGSPENRDEILNSKTITLPGTRNQMLNFEHTQDVSTFLIVWPIWGESFTI